MADIEQQARGMGWVPQAEFRGDASKWVDAQTFVDRGEQFLPILRANNRHLQEEVTGLKSQLSEAQQAIADSKKAVDELRAFYSESTKRQVDKAVKDLRLQLREARQADDPQLELEIEEQLDEAREAQRVARAAPPPAPAPAPAAAPAQQQIDPEFVAWQRDNPWFMKDRRLTAMTIAEAEELRADPANAKLVGRAFYEEAHRRADAILNPRTTTSKVEQGTSTPTNRSAGSVERGYKDLPAEAKAACDEMGSRLVGKGRAFEKVEDWRRHYAEEFFKGE